MTSEELRAAMSRVRCDLADRIESLPPEQWEADSWCAGWRVRDVLGHLVSMAETTRGSLALLIIRNGGRGDRAVDRLARRVGADAVPELARRLRTAGGTSIGGSAAVGLGDVLVHSSDALADLGQEVDASCDEITPVLDAYWRAGRVIVHASPHRGRRLVATDTDRSRGKGPEVRGRARDLMLLLANRRQVVPRLEGPGLAGL
jgi:uncharacterized protein (TIGR03083 family)